MEKAEKYTEGSEEPEKASGKRTPELEPEGSTGVCSVEALCHRMGGWMEIPVDVCRKFSMTLYKTEMTRSLIPLFPNIWLS